MNYEMGAFIVRIYLIIMGCSVFWFGLSHDLCLLKGVVGHGSIWTYLNFLWLHWLYHHLCQCWSIS